MALQVQGGRGLASLLRFLPWREARGAEARGGSPTAHPSPLPLASQHIEEGWVVQCMEGRVCVRQESPGMNKGGSEEESRRACVLGVGE